MIESCCTSTNDICCDGGNKYKSIPVDTNFSVNIKSLLCVSIPWFDVGNNTGRWHPAHSVSFDTFSILKYNTRLCVYT